MADRNPSKQRRQAQNRAAREARKARAEAANTPVDQRRSVEEPEAPKGRRSRRERVEKTGGSRARAVKSREEIRAEARSIVEADAVADTAVADASDTVVGTGVAEQIPVARGRSSAVFSARHRAAIAAATGDRAPARTHVGVADATGTAVLAPRARTSGKSSTSRSGPSGGATTTRRSTGADGSTAAPKASASGGGPRSTPAKRPTPASRRPPAKPLPPFLDRFGGNEPGGRWVMVSFVTVLIASVVVNFVHIVPEIVESGGKKVQTDRYFTIWHYGIGPGLYFLLPPIVILGLFILTARPWDRRRSWNFALAVLVFITFVAQSISIYMIPIACLAWGCWQARKAALDEVGGDPRVLREVERERRIAGKEALRAQRGR